MSINAKCKKRALLAIAYSTAMVPYVVQAVAPLVVFPIIWRLFKHLILQSPLSKVAGPSSGSWWSGTSSNLFLKLTAVWIDIWLGNVSDIFSPTSWDFHDKLAKEYGGAVRVHGFFRVCLPELVINGLKDVDDVTIRTGRTIVYFWSVGSSRHFHQVSTYLWRVRTLPCVSELSKRFTLGTKWLD